MAKKRRLKRPTWPTALAGIVAAIVIGGYLFWDDLQQGPLKRELTYDQSVQELAEIQSEIDWREEAVGQVSTVDLQETELEDTLPPIGTFPLVVDAPGGGVAAEIFVSSEKAGSGTDGWMVEAAKDFNARGVTLGSGKAARIKIRKIASGTGYQFIASGKYRPDGYSPSNHLWIRMAAARGTAMTPIREKTVGNIAGIVMKSEVAEQVKQAAGALSVKSLIESVVQGKLATGYTNPYASSTGLNFLITVLATFAEGDQARMLSPAVASAFEGFQRSIPFVALTTLQMRDSVRRDGSLDAFVMEYQTYIKTAELASGYEFLPFGITHDNPLYAVADPGPEKTEVLQKFAEHLESPAYRKLAKDYGFDPTIQHQAPFEIPDGRVLTEAQRVWKEKKDAGRPIAAVFVGDISGSMDGARLKRLKEALLEGSNFISQDNAIGLVTFSDKVRVNLPIKPFKLLHKSAFHGAVKRLSAGGKTAMYDGIAVGLSLLTAYKQQNPEVKPMLFVLSDGATNTGNSFGSMNAVIQGLAVPVHTIGFEADLEELGRLSGLVEAANLNSSEADLRYKIGSLLNSQM